MNKQYGELADEWDDLLKQKVDLTAKVRELSEEIFNQHTFGFIKAFALAAYFFDISSNHEGFDMMKWVVNAQHFEVIHDEVKVVGGEDEEGHASD